MKKVREKDLQVLIAKYYSKFLDPDHKPINDIIDGHGEIKIDIDSVHINVCNISSNAFDDNNDVAMEIFSRKLEEVTFGNLKVTHSDSSSIDIANSYEVAELN